MGKGRRGAAGCSGSSGWLCPQRARLLKPRPGPSKVERFKRQGESNCPFPRPFLRRNTLHSVPYSLQKFEEEGDSTLLPLGKDTDPEPKSQPNLSPAQHGTSRSLLTGLASTWTWDISFLKEAWEAWKAEQLPAALSQQAQKHALLAELPSDRPGVRGPEPFLLKKGSSTPCHGGREGQGHPGHHSLPTAAPPAAALSVLALLPPSLQCQNESYLKESLLNRQIQQPSHIQVLLLFILRLEGLMPLLPPPLCMAFN